MEKTLQDAKATLPVMGYLNLKDYEIPKGEQLVEAILDLKKEKNGF